MELTDLTWDERVFFAGSLRAMVLADGIVEDEEIAWIDQLRDEDRFDDMDRCLDAFSEQPGGGTYRRWMTVGALVLTPARSSVAK